MRAGELRHRVAFEARPPLADGYGNTQGPDFVVQFTVSAGIVARLGGETVMAARLDGRQPVTITVRRSADTLRIATDWRARDVATGEVYNIRSIADPDDKRMQLDLLCEKGVVT